MLRRIVPLVVAASLLAGAVAPAPVGAMSTQSEIALGQAEDQQIVASSVIETDPLLNAYVQGITGNLWNQVERKDVPYSVKILKDSQINSFATMGGFVYVNEGLIDFVQSDDELASVLGHETGHIERRHVLTSYSKAEILNILFGIASIFSPIIYQFGGLAEAGLMAKISREDEIQADRYGLQLMSRAGYDPESMVTMMAHLAVLQNEHNDAVSKYLEDHPDPSSRIAHLMGYPELDPSDVTLAQQLVQASGDEEHARYEFSRLRLEQLLKKDPNNPEALLELGQSELALGLPNKSEQTLAEAAQLGTPATRAAANARIAALRQMEIQHVTLTKPDLPKLQSSVTSAAASHALGATEIAQRAAQGKDQLKAVTSRLETLQYEVPDLSRIDVKRGSKVEAIVKNLNSITRSLNSALQDAGGGSGPIGGVGSLEKNKESGLLKDSADIYQEMLAPFAMRPVPTESVALFPSYPAMMNGLSLSDGEMLRSVDAARASLTMLDQTFGDLDEFLKALDHATLSFSGDISESEYMVLQPMMRRVVEEFNAAATAASQGAQLFNLARSRVLSNRITLLGLGTSPQIYSTLRYSLQRRFGMDGVDYRTMLREGLTPGDVAAATIIAADIKSTPQSVIAEAKSSGRTVIDVANDHKMHAWPLEIFLGLVYLDYTDDPTKELRKADGTLAVDLNKLGL
ncbi:MAG: M48 family metalloprotease [Candidatus Eremiobacteraeota bacterium]|nr:M48 family metalloprotease [Candidatus Eremiobacteraeota bacterium]MBV9055755.1 M48 family metalloprotease [Candidatus Eremiobacteraeota bacterium]MBV9699159.1 M48 family metalloprotease [Candidatus Eremiobacteraeota bacterium]